ncbi:MAG: hypothetical protein SVR94_11885 [Pseudomonadota bacterium]|nr:hypothetical protein [Pseudomonadota bacterium]
MITLPSLDFIFKKSSAALKRFPMVIASGIIAAIAAIYLSEIDPESAEHAPWIALFMVTILGISLFLAIRLTSERRGWNSAKNITADIAGTGLLTIYFFLLPDDFDAAPHAVFFRYILYMLTAHLLVSVGPYLPDGSVSGFWQYNKTLFLRFLTSILFSGVLFIGLIIALGSIDVLLGVDISIGYRRVFFLGFEYRRC